MVTGAAPTIDVSPAASTTLLTSRDLEMRHPSTLSQALDVVPGVSAISEGQAAVPAIRGLARGRTLILVDGSRSTTERRAGSNASFLDPGVARTIEVARGPGSVAYGSDAFGGVIAVRTRGPDYDESWGVRFAGTAGWGVPEQRGELEVSRGFGSGGLIVGVRARDFDDYDSPSGTVTNSGWRDRGVRARWEHTTNDDLWSVGWQSESVALSAVRAATVTSPGDQPDRGFASADGLVRAAFARRIPEYSAQRARRPVAPAHGPGAAGHAHATANIERADLSSDEMDVRLTAEAPRRSRARAHRHRRPAACRARGAGYDADL